ncbi:hypothetical protein Sjap_016781 [Stephania japonica]|uniref:Protein COFACTOR ASSEMBLY OF COMPLEX C SUBUNIT B CCB3, chloroplastic n=1 Tax=Stephania japonica TaxID=461633 RepID=A0AAP0I4Z9_9MAGN
MTTCPLLNRLQLKGFQSLKSGHGQPSISYTGGFRWLDGKTQLQHSAATRSRPSCSLRIMIEPSSQVSSAEAANKLILRQQHNVTIEQSKVFSDHMPGLALADLDPATAKLAIGVLGPFLSAFAFLFILRIIMSWYPKLPVEKFPYVIAYAPTEPLLIITRKVIPPLGGVDVTPVVWFGIISFLNEILVGPQGLLVLLSQQV